MNYKFEIPCFKAGGWMGVEEGKAERQKGAGWVSPPGAALPDLEVEE